jgi:hypothetical protein
MATREWNVHSWRITASAGPIASEKEKSGLPKVAPPPEQTFLANGLRIQHEPSGWVLSFNAEDALKQSVVDKNEPVKVALANKWQADRVDVLQDVKTMNYDWTYTTSYAGRWSNEKHAGVAMTMRKSDKQLNVELLTDRGVPLVAYHEAPLFVSELDDAGASELTVRVRVTDRTSDCLTVCLAFWISSFVSLCLCAFVSPSSLRSLAVPSSLTSWSPGSHPSFGCRLLVCSAAFLPSGRRYSYAA